MVSRRQCEQIMGISARSGAWDRVRGEQHGGAVRRGEGQFVASGLGVTPKCFRCKGQEKVQECFIVTEEMDVVEEEEDDTDNNRDSGMETDGEMEFFPEE